MMATVDADYLVGTRKWLSESVNFAIEERRI